MAGSKDIDLQEEELFSAQLNDHKNETNGSRPLNKAVVQALSFFLLFHLVIHIIPQELGMLEQSKRKRF